MFKKFFFLFFLCSFLVAQEDYKDPRMTREIIIDIDSTLTTCCSDIINSLTDCCEGIHVDFAGVFTALSDIKETLTECCADLSEDIEDLQDTLTECCEDIQANFGGVFTVLADLHEVLTECCADIVNSLSNFDMDVSGIFTELHDIKETLTECCADIQVNFVGVFTLLSDVNGTLTACCEDIQENFAGVFTVLADLNETLTECCADIVNSLSNFDMDVSSIFTELHDIKETLTECCADIQVNFVGVFTSLSDVKGTLTACCEDIQENFASVFTVLSDIRGTLTQCFDIQVNFEDVFTVLSDIRGTLTECCADIQINFAGVFTSFSDIKETLTECCNDIQVNFESVFTVLRAVEMNFCNPDFITQSDVTSGGLTIDQPGVYKLGENITYSGSGNAITIATPNVILDLQCFNLSTMSGARGVSINNATNSVKINNGTITGFSESGVYVAEDCSNIDIQDISIRGCGTAINFDGLIGSTINTFEINSCKIFNNGKGILLRNSHQGSIQNCLLQTHTAIAIDLQQSFSNEIYNCKIKNVTSNLGAAGIHLQDGGGNWVKDCKISGVSSSSIDSTNRAQGIFINENEFQDIVESNQICKIETSSNAQPIGIEMRYTVSDLNFSNSLDLGATINAIAYSPDGRFIAVGLATGGIRLLDGKTLAQVATRAFSQINSISWSPDGRFIVVGFPSVDPRFRLLDGGTLTEIEMSDLSGVVVQSVSWSPDGRFIAVGLLDETVRLLDGGTLNQIAMSSALGSTVNSVSWSPDGRFIAVGSDDTLELLEIDGGTLAIVNSTPPVNNIRFAVVSWSPDGRFIAAGLLQNKNVRLFDGKTLDELVVSGGFGTQAAAAGSLSWSSDGRFLAVGLGGVFGGAGDVSVRLLDGNTLDEVVVSEILIDAFSPSSISWSSDGRFIVWGRDSVVRLLDALIFPSNHLIKDNLVSMVNGPTLPVGSIGVSSGHGISASSFGNTILSNQALNNDLNYNFAAAEQFLQLNMPASLGSAVPTRLSNFLYPSPAVI